MSFTDYNAADIACEAYVARPAGPGPHPTVLIAPTVRGPTPLEHAKADALAAEGYLAIVLDHYGKDQRDLGDRAQAAQRQCRRRIAGAADVQRHDRLWGPRGCSRRQQL